MVHKKVVGCGLTAAGFFIAALLVACVALGGDGGMADDRIVDLSEIEIGSGEVLTASSVSSSINYQGRLTDSSGNPLSGTYSMTFTLYDTASGGTALGTDTHNVVVSNGLFLTIFTFDQSYFDGRKLWLGIKVGSDPEMTPRQALRAVPYALSLRPGAVIEGSLVGEPILWARNSGENGEAIHAGVAENGGTGVRVVALGEESYGVHVSTTGDYSKGIGAITTGNDSLGVYAATSGYDSHGVYSETSGCCSMGVSAYTAGNYSRGVYAFTTGNYSPAIYGQSDKDVGVYGKGKEAGGYFTTTAAGTLGHAKLGVNVSTQYDHNYGISASTSGYGSPGVLAVTTGNVSAGYFAQTSGYDSSGVFSHTFGDSSQGLFVLTQGNDSHSLDAWTVGNRSDGVHTVTSGHASKGVYARTTGANSPAVYGESALAIGVYGKGNNDGVKGESTNGNAVHGLSSSGNGLLGESTGGAGVRGVSTTNYGVVGWTTAQDRSGVYGWSNEANGVKGWTNSTNEWIPAIYGRNDGAGDGVYGWSLERYGTVGVSSSDTDAGVWGLNHESGIGVLGEVKGNGVGVMGVAPLEGWAADFRGNVKIRSSSTGATVIELGEGLDYAEGFDVSNEAEIEPGTVMSIDSYNPGKLTVCGEPYDRKVAGIVAGAGGLGSAVRLGGDQFNYDVALAGRVYCNVDATYGEVAPGDLLTTSPTPGYAMVVEDYARAQGAILGKAMEGLEEGQKGQILVLVTLQ